MREILIISGKGGTGKTSLTAAFTHLAASPVICDLDVDAPDLHLLLHPQPIETQEFYSGHEARIMDDRCTECGTCLEMCAYDAVESDTGHPVINPLKCEGCKVCVHFCPEQAIAFTSRHCGTWYQADTRFGTMLHAQLFPGEENSGRLVALLRQNARKVAKTRGLPLILADGLPGIGCPTISALSGAHLAVIVTEPTLSGVHDMDRVFSLCEHFRIPVAVIINKCDLNTDITGEIRAMCRRKGYPILTELPHDPVFVEAMVAGKAVTEFSNADASKKIARAWKRITTLASDSAGQQTGLCNLP